MSEQTLWSFYTQEARRQMQAAFSSIRSLDDWQQQRPELARQFMVSMGLEPLPARCDLDVQACGELTGQGYRAARLNWQLLPGCRATGHFYLPDPLPPGQPLPGVLYTCGHRPIGVHGYQHHAIAWARRGYACLVFDTVEQHDNRSDHHGLYVAERLDWISLGYTGAGGELWNSIRALDVLASRPEVDPQRLGVTGISGGGAHSFYLAVADERIKAVATVAGVSLPPYAIGERYLQGHCDCMYAHNPFGRDWAEFAALIAPRPALFAFARHDPLYTLKEFRGLADRTRKVYDLMGCGQRCELFEYDGPHAYQPHTIERIQQWFDEHLAGDARPLDTRIDHEHDEPAVTVFNGAPPSDDRMHLLAELLTPLGRVELPHGESQWDTIRRQALGKLQDQVLRLVQDDTAGSAGQPWQFERVGQWLLKVGIKQKYHALSGGMEVMAMLVSQAEDYDAVVITVASPEDDVRAASDRVASHFGANAAVLAIEPRGTGFTSVHPAHRHHLERAGALVGLTPTMLMVQDLWRLMPHFHALPEVAGRKIYLHGKGDAAVACLYHALFDDRVAGLVLEDMPRTHRDGGYMLGILRCLDLPEAVGLMAPRPVGMALDGRNPRGWLWATRAYDRLGCPDSLTITHSLTRAFEQVTQAAACQPAPAGV